MVKKTKIKVWVDPEIWEAFKNFVFSKYGTLNKYLGEELSRAMKQYLDATPPAHTQEFEHTSLTKKHLLLLRWLLDNYPSEVLYSHLVEFIRDNVGIDYRTVRKYIHDFLIQGGFLVHARVIRGGNDYIFKVQVKRILNYLRAHVSEDVFRLYSHLLHERDQEGVEAVAGMGKKTREKR